MNKYERYKRIAELQVNCVECEKECNLCPFRVEMDQLINIGEQERPTVHKAGRKKGRLGEERWAYIETLPISYVTEIYEHKHLTSREKVETLMPAGTPIKTGMMTIEDYIELYQQALNKTPEELQEQKERNRTQYDEKGIIALYQLKGITYTAKHYNLSFLTIYTIIDRNGIPRKKHASRRHFDGDEQEVVEYYKRNNIQKTASKFGMGVRRVYAILHKYNVEIKKAGYQKGRKRNEEQVV